MRNSKRSNAENLLITSDGLMRERLENPNARILIATVEPLWPSTHGGRIRTAKIAETLSAQGLDVRVVAPDRPNSEWRGVPANIEWMSFRWRPPRSQAGRLHWLPWLGLFAVPDRRHLQEMIDDFQPDFIYWSHSYLAAVGMNKVSTRARNIVEFANIERDRFLSLAQSGPFRNRASAYVEYLKSCIWEPFVARRADVCVAISQADREALSRMGAEVITVENAFPVVGLTHSPDTATVLSLANWDYAPNREGIEHFLLHQWEAVTTAVPDARLILVGKGSEAVCAGISNLTNVVPLGFVDNPSDIYKNAALFLAPARSGAGSQLKVAEALGHSRCVVGPAFLERERRAGLPATAVCASEETSAVIIAGLTNTSVRWDTERAISSYAEKHDWWFETADLLHWINDRVMH